MKSERNSNSIRIGTGGFRKRHPWALPILLMSSAACSEPRPAQSAGAFSEPRESNVAQDRSNGPAVTDLPFAQGRSFTSLDEYLAFLRKRGAYDVLWYREIRPGVYELVTRRAPGREPQTFTREELERRFGFTR